MNTSKASFKKILAAIGCLTFYFICIYAVVKDHSLTVAVLVNLSALIVALFGLKKWDGKIGSLNVNEKKQDSDG